MRHITAVLFAFALSSSAGMAQSSWFGIPRITTLSPEEVRLVHAFRANPGPFLQVIEEMNEQARTGEPVDMEHGTRGPRTVIDVQVEGGRIAFYGRPREFEPVEFQIGRGEERDVVFRETGAAAETRVRMAFRSDGFHFDVPEAYGYGRGQPRGFVVVAEDARWNGGVVAKTEENIADPRSRSMADHISLRIKYYEQVGKSKADGRKPGSAAE